MTRQVSAAVIAVAVTAIYALRIDPVAGLIVDDAWYIVLAKAIAQGDGYRLISSATAQILPAFPPGFPAILSVVFRASPEYPGNLWLLKSVSIVAMLGVGLVTYRYLVRYRSARPPLAAAVAISTVLSPALVFLATSTVMAECVFTLAQLGVVLVIERAARAESAPRMQRDLCLAAVMAAGAVLLRSAGIAVVLAGAVYLVKARGWRWAMVFGAVVAACLTPWAVYANVHAPTRAERVAHGGSIAYTYDDLLTMRKGGYPTSGRASLDDLPARVGVNLVNVFGRSVGAIIFPAAFRGSGESGQEVVALGGETGLQAASMGGATATVIVSLVISAITLAGFVGIARQHFTLGEVFVPLSIGMIVLVPAPSFRYMLPLVPFVFFYFFAGLETIVSGFRRAGAHDPRPVMRIAALCVTLLFGLEHAQYLWQLRVGPLPNWIEDHREVSELAGWMERNLPATAAVATTNPGLVYLLTSRTTVGSDDPEANWERWRTSGIRYVAALRPAELPRAALGYRLLYRSLGQGLWILELRSP
ncbi:MAG: hypothetical protein Q7R30_18965 [Acidobacteriota bacterium]|nr:hypothetical protein [Acidobacteriota bacterium]